MKHFKLIVLAAIAVFSGNLLFAQNGQLASANEINQNRQEFLISNSQYDAVSSNTNESKVAVANESFSILPDFNGNDFTANFTTPKTGYATLTVKDITGRVVIKETVAVTKGANQQLIKANQLKSGMYFVSILNGQVNYNGKMQRM